MPRITEYSNTQDLSASPVEGSAMSRLRLGRIEEGEIQQTGQRAQRVVGQIEEQRAQHETTKLATQIAATNSQLFDDWEQTKQTANPDDPDVAKNFIDQHIRPQLESLNDGLYTTQGKDMLAKATANMTNEWHERTATDFAHMQANAAGNAGDMIQSSATKAAYQDPTSGDRQIELMQTNLAGLYASHGVPQDKIDEAVRKGSTAIQYAQGLGMIDKNPVAALSDLQNKDKFSYLDGGQIAQLTERARDKIKTQNDKIIGAERVGFEDAAARMHDFGTWGPNTNYTRDQAEALGGDNPGERARLGQLWDVATAAGKENASANAQDMSLPAQAQHAQDVAASASTAPDYHAGAAAATAAVEAYTRRKAAFDKDPNAYVAQKSPFVAEAWAKYAQNPAPQTFQEAATMSMAEQRRIDPTSNPRVMPTEAVAQIKAQLGTLDQAGGAERAAQVLGYWQNTVGTNLWPQAVSELRAKKALTAEQSVAANLAADGKSAMATDLLQASVLKNTDLSKSVAHTNLVQASVSRALRPLQDSLAYDPGGGAYVRDQVDAMTKLALFEARKNPSANVGDLVKSALLDNYQFRGSMRIPNSINAGIVSSAAQNIQASLTQDTIGGNADASSVREHGHWVTLAGDTGMRLVDDAGRQVFEKTASGSFPLQRTWAELTTKATPWRATLAPAGSQPVAAGGDVKNMVRSAAATYGVPEHIALGQIELESNGFQTHPKNDAEVIGGLGQLTQRFVKDYGAPGEDANDPQTNVNIAMRGMADLHRRYGSWEEALKHYGDPKVTNYSDLVMKRAEKYK